MTRNQKKIGQSEETERGIGRLNLPPERFNAKRFFDAVVSGGVLVVFSPLLLFMAFAVKVTSPGTIFFTGKRIGRGGKPFRIIKFRTMVKNAEKTGSTITAEGDPRVTRIGRFLRQTKLDELPTLINVLSGEMSLVGPRPETPPWIPLYTPEERNVLLVHPGITSLATIQYRYEEKLLAGKDIEEAYPPVMRDKLRIELEYLRNRTFMSDLRIIGQTLMAIVQRHSETQNGSSSSSPGQLEEAISYGKAPSTARSKE